MATRAFIFDMDGTMVDSMPAHKRSWDEFRRRHGVGMEVDEIMRRTTGRNGVECIRVLMGDDVPEERALELVGEKEAIYRDIFGREFREVAGFAGFVQRAREERALKTAVATAGDRNNLAFVLERLRLGLPPDAVVRGDEGLPGKPEPAIFLAAAERLGVPAAECIVFEDAPFGIEAARRAGMRAVGVCTSHGADELKGSHVLAHVRDYTELLEQKFLESLYVS